MDELDIFRKDELDKVKELMEQKWREYIDNKLSTLLHELETLNQEILKMKEKLGKGK
jgi:hypothetical protein